MLNRLVKILAIIQTTLMVIPVVSLIVDTPFTKFLNYPEQYRGFLLNYLAIVLAITLVGMFALSKCKGDIKFFK